MSSRVADLNWAMEQREWDLNKGEEVWSNMRNNLREGDEKSKVHAIFG